MEQNRILNIFKLLFCDKIGNIYTTPPSLFTELYSSSEKIQKKKFQSEYVLP